MDILEYINHNKWQEMFDELYLTGTELDLISLENSSIPIEDIEESLIKILVKCEYSRDEILTTFTSILDNELENR